MSDGASRTENAFTCGFDVPASIRVLPSGSRRAGAAAAPRALAYPSWCASRSPPRRCVFGHCDPDCLTPADVDVLSGPRGRRRYRKQSPALVWAQCDPVAHGGRDQILRRGLDSQTRTQSSRPSSRSTLLIPLLQRLVAIFFSLRRWLRTRFPSSAIALQATRETLHLTIVSGTPPAPPRRPKSSVIRPTLFAPLGCPP